ncbi:MAG: tol-pal system protein YbgF [Pseudomonadota bacterium]
MVELRAKTSSCFLPAWLAILVVSLCATSCHDHSALEMQIAELRKELSQIRTVQGNSGAMLEDMDNRLLLLNDQVDSNRLMLGSSGPPAALPVVRLQPGSGPIYPAEVMGAVEATAPEPYPYLAPPTPEPPAPEPATAGTIQFQMLDEYGNVVASGGGASSLNAGGGAAPPRTGPAERSATVKSDDARALGLYKKGMALLNEKRHREAVAMFEDFLSQFPQHSYADNCTYWIGEAYYDRQMVQQALAHFEQVVVQYPRGNKVPDAMLKAAFCYSSLGMRDRAAELFETLIRTFPGTTAAQLAEKRKAELL